MGLNYYGILEIDKNAADLEIKKAYIQLALKYHPKKNKDEDAKERFFNIAEAYDVLSTPKIKAMYDEHGEEAIKKGISVPSEICAKESLEKYSFHGNPIKVFRNFFGVDNTGPEVERTFSLSLNESFHGTVKFIDVPLKVVNESATGTVDVVKKFTFKIPKGTTDGQCFYFKAAGISGPNMSPGNVILRAEILPDSAFRLEGQNVVLTQTVSLSEALLGCTVDVTTFDGKKVHLQVTEVIHPKYRIHLKGEGMPITGLGYKSDLIVEFNVIFPEKITSRQQKLIEEAFNIKTN